MVRTRSLNPRFEVLAWLLSGTVVALAVILIERPSTYFWKHFSNVSHVLLAFLLAWGALRVSRILLTRFFSAWQFHYAVASAIIVAAGGGLEIAQYFTVGTPSRQDLAFDLLGGGAALAFLLSLEVTQTTEAVVGRLSAWLLRALSASLIAVGLFPSLSGLRNLHRHWSSFPVLADFEEPWEKEFVSSGIGERLSFVPPPKEFSTAHGEKVAKLVFMNTGERPPRLKLIDLRGDWASYASLDFEIYAPPEQEPVTLTFSIHDDGPMGYDEHFNQILHIKPGLNRFSIAREFIRNGASNRPMRLNEIENLVLFMKPPAHERTLYFDHFRLQP